MRATPPGVRGASPAASDSSPYLRSQNPANSGMSVSIRYVGLSGIPRDGNQLYPHTEGCYGTSSKIFLPTSSTEVTRRTGLNIPTGSPIPPELQRLLASKKTVEAGAVGRRPSIRFERSRGGQAGEAGGGGKWFGMSGRKLEIVVNGGRTDGILALRSPQSGKLG